MRTEVKDLGNNQKAITIEVPQDVAMEKINEAYRRINESARLKGFRPGKIPRNVLRVHFWSKVKTQAINDLVPDYFQKALDEEKLQIMGQPKFEGEIELREEAPFSFQVVVTTWPRTELPESYKGIEITKEKKEVTEERIGTVLRRLQDQQAEYQVVTDRAVLESDQVVLDYTSKDSASGDVLEVDHDLVVEVGSSQLLPSLSQNLVGMQRGEEREFHETFPEEFPNKRFAHKEVTFIIMIKEIKEKTLPDLDDEFARDLGDYTLQRLKEEIAENLKRQDEEESQKNMRKTLIDKLLAMTPVDAPEIMVDHEIEAMINDLEAQLALQGRRLAQSEQNSEKLRADLRESASKRAKTSLILYEIACREGIEVTEEEINRRARQLSMQYRQDIEDVKKSLRDEIMKTLREQKTLDFLLESAIIKEEATIEREKDNL
ncbi:MAG: trigger factor [bacterium]